MSSSDFSIEQSDIEKLNEKDKGELRQFFANEEHRARIQNRMSAVALNYLQLHACPPHLPPWRGRASALTLKPNPTATSTLLSSPAPSSNPPRTPSPQTTPNNEPNQTPRKTS